MIEQIEAAVSRTRKRMLQEVAAESGCLADAGYSDRGTDRR
jgi:hypothetical protein